MGGVNGPEEGAESRDERIERYYHESAWDLAERVVDLEDRARELEGDCVRLADELDDARTANEELAGYARDGAHWEAVADRMRAEIARLQARKCLRCNDTGIDPEHSYPAEGPSYYSMGEPEHLEPCIDCQFPRPEELDRYRIAWISARRRAAMESVYATEALAMKEAEIAHLKDRLTELDHTLSWHTTCSGCARLLDSCYAETCRAEKAEEELTRVNADRAHLRKSWAAMSGCLIKLGRHEDLTADDVKDIPGAHAAYLRGHGANREYSKRARAFVAEVQKIRNWAMCASTARDLMDSHLRPIYNALYELEDADREYRPFRDEWTRNGPERMADMCPACDIIPDSVPQPAPCLCGDESATVAYWRAHLRQSTGAEDA